MGDKESNGNGSLPIDVWLSRFAQTAGPTAAAGWGALLQAWRSETRGDLEQARGCRERALEFWQCAIDLGEAITTQAGATTQLLLTETYRRLARFEEAQTACHRGLSGRPKDPIRSLLEFELELIGSRDCAPHRVNAVI